jgi:hypothetical protein
MGIEPGKVGANFYLCSKMKIQFNFNVEPINMYRSSDRRDMKIYTTTVKILFQIFLQKLAKHTRGRVGEEGGPPPWIPFGHKIVRPNPQDRNFKVYQNNSLLQSELGDCQSG